MRFTARKLFQAFQDGDEVNKQYQFRMQVHCVKQQKLDFLSGKTLTVRLLEQGHLKEDYLITKFLENKRFFLTFINLKAVSCMRSQVSSNGLKVFNDFILEP